MNWIDCEHYTPWVVNSRGEELNDMCVNRSTRMSKRCDRCREKGGER